MSIDKILKKKDADYLMSVLFEVLDSLNKDDSLKSIIEEVRNYNFETYHHCVGVAMLSAAIGMYMEYDKSDLKNLIIAGLYHDTGKLKVDLSIITKKGKLTKEEYTEIKCHPLEGYKTMKDAGIKNYKITDAIIQHHERMDGKGYPLGLKSYQISKYSKILMIADVFEALTSDRTYRKAYSIQDALYIMMTQEKLDCEIMGVFIRKVINQNIIQENIRSSETTKF